MTNELTNTYNTHHKYRYDANHPSLDPSIHLCMSHSVTCVYSPTGRCIDY